MLPKDIFKNHIHIGIDLDETLASTSSGMLEVAHDMGKLLHCSSTEDLSIHDIFDDPSFMVTEQEMLEIWQEYNIRTMSPLNVPPQEGAIQGIGSLFTA